MMHLKGSCQSVEEANERLDRENLTLKAELDRLKKCLEKANANAENFEREWYLRGDALESAQSDLADMRRGLEEAKAEIKRLAAVGMQPEECPWCHAEPEVRRDWTNEQYFRADCTNAECPVQPNCRGASEEEVIGIWNRGAKR